MNAIKRVAIVVGVLAGVFGQCSIAHAELRCYDCHGDSRNQDIRPVDSSFRNISTGGFSGNHRSHLPQPLSLGEIGRCAACHPGSGSYNAGHRNGLIEVSTRINASPLETPYKNRTTAFPQTSTPTLGSCGNVNCHFESASPTWGGPPFASPAGCTGCHGAPPQDNNHPRHFSAFSTSAGRSIENICVKCHADHTKDAKPFAHAGEGREIEVNFTAFPNSGGSYVGGSTAYPSFLPSQNPQKTGSCVNLYCHSDGNGGAPNLAVKWSDSTATRCDSCHRGRGNDFLNMTSNGHSRLVGPQWIRKYPCTYCHNATIKGVTDQNGRLSDGFVNKEKHVDGTRDVVIAPKWGIVGREAPSYDASTKVCDNVYCHSDGTTDPETVRPFAWNVRKTDCNTCHGHPRGSCSDRNSGCHDGRTDEKGKIWVLPERYQFGNVTTYAWPPGEEWKAAIPMFKNQGAGTARANSHARHTETSFTCDNCHSSTTINGTCTDCHAGVVPVGKMSEVSHLNPDFHVNKTKDVFFRDGGTYNNITKACSGTVCHTGGADPIWGEADRPIICLSCHGTSGGDTDDFQAFNNVQGRVNMTEWFTTGHGRYSTSGRYPSSGNPAANFPGNPCWYCHDNTVLHKDGNNPFRLRIHPQFTKRYEKECRYCHMEGNDDECLGCHYSPGSLALQMNYSSVRSKHGGVVYTSGCRVSCHLTDATLHKSGSPLWSKEQNDDVKNQYLMMGVCLQCHDDDTGGQCTGCHVSPPDNPFKYELGYDPGTGRIKPKKARASSVHFGYKHYRGFESTGGWTKDANGKPLGKWKGGKFCWDCHDPHGDKNIYMVQDKVATETDGRFGVPTKRADVSFRRRVDGTDYARQTAPYNGICNVCHSSSSKHFTAVSGDGHNAGRVCTSCHEHRFTDSHADGASCNSCHFNKPVPRHSGFGLPRDCVKCHGGAIGKRMDVMTQFRAKSHHVQGVPITNKQCYACHWESTELGLIDVRYHTGYNFKTYTTVKNDVVDLVVWGPGVRPTAYKNYSTAIQFLAGNMAADGPTARGESQKLNDHCLSCHSDQNNDTDPFNDCKTPRQYAWDLQSIASRYSQQGTTLWGKYAGTNNAKKNVPKALSAHGNAVANKGGWDPATGIDGAIPNTRDGAYNVTCFDCHSSHGSKAPGVTSSYVTFNGTKNGGNLKETQAGKGGYAMSYWATPNTAGNNPYNTGAGQCFDCHMSRMSGLTPWGYESTFGATKPVKGYKDAYRFGTRTSVYRLPYAIKDVQAVKGGHLKVSSPLDHAATKAIEGLCTPCHDPHGVSQSLGAKQSYAVPLLKGTWLTSPYKEDNPAPDPTGTNITNDSAGVPRSWGKYQAEPTPTQPYVKYSIDRNTFDGTNRITEGDDKFAGLCLRCHLKADLNGTNDAWKSSDRIHKSVKGWGTNKEHTFSCSKCHQPHQSGLPRLMQTNCLDYKHRGNRMSGGNPWAADRQVPGSAHDRGGEHRGYPTVAAGLEATTACHVSRFNRTYSPSSPPAEWPNENYWNVKTPW
ncbi:CxxxxCH/CxxCH domain-containing protein [Geobacter sp. DSM 9736]|uniref:CxxxxCH/CxxCH domain c-type cytochrome n=1 Tax=Geobacter sp. DSM 9736 TaxID=1277350 RepID=UPI000B60048F|nr:CxxxxCH/CxxCH domain-containing protein [Geobacter sp. DSM 9736]SNB47457.1 Geobacter sulfurreducens CxxxxCH...CXXCH domain-containing protein [Geobacter sp. DSM 9736]